MIARIVSTITLVAANDNQTSYDDDIKYEFQHGCGRFIRADAFDLDYEEDEDGTVYYYEHGGSMYLKEWISLAYAQCRIEETLGWNTKIVISWVNE